MTLPISKAAPIIIIESPAPTKSSVKPTILKYAAHPAIAKADINKKIAKKYIRYTYS